MGTGQCVPGSAVVPTALGARARRRADGRASMTVVLPADKRYIVRIDRWLIKLEFSLIYLSTLKENKMLNTFNADAD